MCLAAPGKVIRKENTRAVVDFDGVQLDVNISLVPDINPGEYCIVHAGYAIEKVDNESASDILNIIDNLNNEDIN